MARARNPNRDEACNKWLESGGKKTVKELAVSAGVPEQRIRKWKSEDKWQQKLDEINAPKRGGQRGNRNAEGHGAPKGNSNAETHGAYSRIHLDSLTPEEREYIEGIIIDAPLYMVREYQILCAKERDLLRKIRGYEEADSETLYIDRVVEMLVPREKERLENSQKKLEEMQIEWDNMAWEIDSNPNPSKTSINKLDKLSAEIAAFRDKVDDKTREYEDKGQYKTSMQTVMKASPFDRAMKLEAEYNKIHGRILKLIDSMRAYEVDKKRLNLDKRKHALAKQRLTGEYDIDPNTGEINDIESAEDEDVDI